MIQGENIGNNHQDYNLSTLTHITTTTVQFTEEKTEDSGAYCEQREVQKSYVNKVKIIQKT